MAEAMIEGTINVDHLSTMLAFGFSIQIVTLVPVTWLVIRGK